MTSWSWTPWATDGRRCSSLLSDTDDSFNFLISMCYTQLFNLLCEKADDVYGGRLAGPCAVPHRRVRQHRPDPQAGKAGRHHPKREISACLVLQAQSQLKAIYKDNADTIIGNMDSSIFLGGKEPTTLKELEAVLARKPLTPTTRREPGAGDFPLASTIKNWEGADEPG